MDNAPETEVPRLDEAQLSRMMAERERMDAESRYLCFTRQSIQQWEDDCLAQCRDRRAFRLSEEECALLCQTHRRILIDWLRHHQPP